MARRFAPPPAYVQTLNQGYRPGGIDGGQAYRNAVVQSYDERGGMINGDAIMHAYNPQEAAMYAQEQQRRFQGEQAVDPRALAQAAYDRQQAANLQQVGGQRGAGGQAQGLRAAMMGTTQASAAQSNALTQAQQEQTAQRQAILQQQLATEKSQADMVQARRDEKDDFNKKRSDNDAAMGSTILEGISSVGGGAMSDERAKKVKRARAPKLVIMMGGK